jgi:ATP-dependent Clp protease ATP-binding subunit ClpC
MFSKLNRDAHGVLNAAIARNKQFGHQLLLPEHLLIALAAATNTAPGAAFSALSLDPLKMTALVSGKFPPGSLPVENSSALSPALGQALKSAADTVPDGEKVGPLAMARSLIALRDAGVEDLLSKFDLTSDDAASALANLHDRVLQPAVNTAEPEQAAPLEFCRDLTQAARDGELDPVIGRKAEIRRVMQVLARRVKNNPVLVGDPGVGKTAIAEGLAALLASGDVPKALKDRPLLQVDLAGMLAGARYRGDFEERLKKLMKDAKKANAILFVDEIHTVVGAGAAGTPMDAAQILKESLARGELTMLGATTVKEYRKHIEPDAALERRFTQVSVSEPSTGEVIEILERLSGKYEAHHGVKYEQGTLAAAVNLTGKHIRSRFNPDKSIDVMDEAGAAVAMERLLDSEVEPIVTLKHIEDVVSQIAGIAVGSVSTNEKAMLRNLSGTLAERVIGQDGPVATVARSVRRRRAGMSSKARPASFLFAGPTGVGKTELAKALADTLFADPKTGRGTLVRFDMSEFSEKHTVSRLFGAPPGYVGYDEGGQLTEAVLKNPASVVLLDEIEKAHTDVFDSLLQVLDDGRMTDGQGRVVSFADTIVIMTTNQGARAATQERLGFGASTAEDSTKAIIKSIKDLLRPEFLNRLDDILVFDALNGQTLESIARTMVDEVVARALDEGVALTVTDAALAALVEEGTSAEYGARPLRRTIERHLADQVTDAILEDTGTLLTADVNEDGTVVVESTRLAEPMPA